MKYLQKLISRQFYRYTLFGALPLMAAYSLGGFLLLPHIIHNALAEQVKQQLGWQAKIEQSGRVQPLCLELNYSECQNCRSADTKAVIF